MKVSIITSCYNREATIRGAIESVLEQDYPDIEYIVVDGASKDNSLAVIYNPQNEMFRLLGTKRSFSQNETFFFSHPYPALFRLISHF